jgi:hypothetical protein
MNNVTEINATNEINETLVKINRRLPKSHKPDVELINIDDDYFLGEIHKKYDLPKFIRSLTDEELTWKSELQITGTVQFDFMDTPPEDICDDEDALEEYMDNLYAENMELEMGEVIDTDLEISYQPIVVVSPKTVAKLEDAKFQMKKYQVEGADA